MWEHTRDELLKSVGGAYLFGIAFLYTMEMWWIGDILEAWKLLLFLLGALVINIHLAYFSTDGAERNLVRAVWEAVVSLALGALLAAATLLVFNRISLGDPVGPVLGKIIVQAVPLSIGAAVGNAVFDGDKDRTWDDEALATHNPLHATINDLGATIGGGVFIGMPIAPTDEIPMLASGMELVHLLAVMLLSLLLTYLIVFESGFHRGSTPQINTGPFQRPITETVLAYLLSLAVAFLTLFLFGQIQMTEPLYVILAQMIVLGLPISVGGAAGRLVI